MAKRVGGYLNEKGVKVVRFTNANHFKYAETMLFYRKGYKQAAEYMATQLPMIQKIEELNGFDRPRVNIKVLIGRDLIPHNKSFENGGRS
ncbi:MAG: LytR family transcriptional regulator [Deltaproteobacteria bacterium]|nr:MAG: LytR family transcriptional regulator [Deltaproteobacteria bacterium]